MSYNNVEQKTENVVSVDNIIKQDDWSDEGEQPVIPTEKDKKQRNIIVVVSIGIVFCCVVAYVLYKIGGN